MPAPTDPEYRRCPATARWVIIAPVRAHRPMILDHARPHHRERHESRPCPLCEGSEADTPQEVYADRRPGTVPNGPGWSLRVVPNKYPAVRPLGDPRFQIDGELNLFDSIPGFGEHELVIECPDHLVSPTELTDARLAAVLVAYRERLKALAGNPLFQYATVFKNVGAEAGASLAHLHSQIVATPVVPEAVRRELEVAAEYHDRRGRCVYCDVLAEELVHGSRLVAESDRFVAVCPFAPRFPYELWVLPKAHESRYETLADADELARLMKRVVGGLDSALAGPAFNLCLHTSPLRSDPLPHYHWHIEVLPRTNRQAGFEWGSGCFINPISPERAADELRRATR